MEDILQMGERVLLVQDTDRSYMIRLEPGGRFSSHHGNYEHDQIAGKRPGQWIASHRGRAMLLLRPSTVDLMMKVKRQTNIIYPKDAAQLMLHCGIVPGTRVLEVGTGSGSLTIALALAVGPTGRVYTCDVREDLQKRGKSNVLAAGLGDRVEFILRGPGEPFSPEEVDVAVLDVPTPWLEIETVAKSLKLGGRLASLNPTYNQIEQCAAALEASGCFALVEAEEILWRKILARPGRTRPEQRMVGHTEFLLYAVRAEPLIEAAQPEPAEALEPGPEPLPEAFEPGPEVPENEDPLRDQDV
jgi:tRNA (adenine57-N1/adenine58-N1)-methyltransferase catalytic subunit